MNPLKGTHHSLSPHRDQYRTPQVLTEQNKPARTISSMYRVNPQSTIALSGFKMTCTLFLFMCAQLRFCNLPTASLLVSYLGNSTVKPCFTLSIYAVQSRKTWCRCVTHSSSRDGKWLSHYVLFVKIILPFGMVGLNYGHPHSIFTEEPFSCPFVICKTNSSSRGAIWTVLTPMLLFRNKTA